MFRKVVAPGIELRQFALADAEPVYAAVDRNREYLREWLPWVDHTQSPDDVREFITRTLAQHDAGNGPQTGLWIDNQIRGSVGCHPIDWPNRSCAIGYWLEATDQRKGVVTRCCVAMLDYLFEELKLHRVEIRCGTGNMRSCAIPQRLGFRREGVLQEAEWVSGRWVDLVVWGIVEQEWRLKRPQ